MDVFVGICTENETLVIEIGRSLRLTWELVANSAHDQKLKGVVPEVGRQWDENSKMVELPQVFGEAASFMLGQGREYRG